MTATMLLFFSSNTKTFEINGLWVNIRISSCGAIGCNYKLWPIRSSKL